MKKLRILALMHEDLVPPDNKVKKREEIEELKTEYDVVTTLAKLGHEVKKLGVRYELHPIRQVVDEWKPQIVFNLLEEFRDIQLYDQNVVAYLELLGVPYTGCNPRGLILARDKALSKKVLTYHRIRVPKFTVVPIGRKPRRPKGLELPLFVKSLTKESSLGISQASLVETEDKLAERVRFIHARIRTDAIAEQYIEGRELYACVLGSRRLRVLPVWELVFDKAPDDVPLINTAKAKWDLEYQKKWGVGHRAAQLPTDLQDRILKVSKRIYRILGLSGYARLDFRLTKDGNLYFLEANPNPEIASDEEFARAAEAGGTKYDQLLQKIVNLGLRYRAEAR